MDRHDELETALDDRERLLATQSRVLVQLARLRALEQQDLAGAAVQMPASFDVQRLQKGTGP